MNKFEKKLEEAEKLKSEMSPELRGVLESVIGEIRSIVASNGILGVAALLQVYNELMAGVVFANEEGEEVIDS